MIILLGASGYYGRAFAAELRRRGLSFIPLTRRAYNYARFDFLFDYLRTMKPEFLINAANYVGAAGEPEGPLEREQAMSANALLPQMIARACLMTKTPWGHLSTGSVYIGCKRVGGGREEVEKDLTSEEFRREYASNPGQYRGFKEEDETNYSFRWPPCAFYSGSKALGEEAIYEIGQSYIWRLRMPFNELDEPCNLLRQPVESLDDAVNSMSHLEDCVKACLDLWEMHAPFGIYNVTNPGALNAREIVRSLPPAPKRESARSTFPVATSPPPPRSNCILDVSKLLRSGVRLRPVNEVMDEAVEKLRAVLRRGGEKN